MNIKKLLIGGVVGGIVYFLLGWLIYGNFLMEFMAKHHGMPAPIGVNRTEPLFLYIMLGNLVGGILMAYIFLKSTVNSLIGGLILGGVIGFLMAASMDSIMYATTNLISRTGVLADIAAATVMNAIAGAVIGFTLSKVKD